MGRLRGRWVALSKRNGPSSNLEVGSSADFCAAEGRCGSVLGLKHLPGLGLLRLRNLDGQVTTVAQFTRVMYRRYM